MRLLDWLSSPNSALGRGVEDSRRAVTWMRHTLRGNRIAPSSPCEQPRRNDGNGVAPVLLIHGYLATRGSLALLERRLNDQGHLVLSYRLGLLHASDISDSAGLIARKIESIVAQTGLHHLDIVGHSMGGLVAMFYLKRLGGHRRVRRLVMLGTPVTGTWSALIGVAAAPLSRASLQMLPESRFLRELAEGELPEGVEIVCISGERDRLAPPERTHLAGVRHICLPTNHAGLLVDAQVSAVVGDILRAPSVPNAFEIATAAHCR